MAHAFKSFLVSSLLLGGLALGCASLGQAEAETVSVTDATCALDALALPALSTFAATAEPTKLASLVHTYCPKVQASESALARVIASWQSTHVAVSDAGASKG
jgi:hypothetical protein